MIYVALGGKKKTVKKKKNILDIFSINMKRKQLAEQELGRISE